MKSLSLLILLTFAMIQSGHAAKITDDTLTIGAPGSTANKVLKLGSRYIRDNVSQGTFEFSTDGTLYKKLGSGSGSGGDGGVSVLENASFEDGLTPGWTSSGGTFSQQTYTASTEGDTKYARLVATAAGQYFESTLKAIPDSVNGGCLAKIDYSTTTASAFKIQVIDSTAAVLKDGDALPALTWKKGYVSFQCPAAASTLKVRITSLLAGTINVDRVYLGQENRTYQARYDQFEYYYATGFGVNANGDVGSVQVIEQNLSKLLNAPTLVAGNVQIIPKVPVILKAFGARQDSNNLSTCAIVKNGSIELTSISSVVTSNSPGVGGCYVEIPAGPSDIITINFNGQSNTNSKIAFSATSISTGDAISAEAQDWFVDVNIGGANPTLGVANVASYQGIENASLDMILNSGSAPAKIPCAANAAASGLVCTGGTTTESVGVNFTNPTPGYFEVCGNFSHYIQGYNQTQMNATFQWVETTQTQAIIQEGRERTHSGLLNDNNAVSVYTVNPHRNCGVFYFASSSERTIRLMFEQQIINANPQSSVLMMDRNASIGQRDMHITVRNLNQPYNKPYLLDKKKKVQVKKLTSNISTNTTGVSDLSFNNLVVGKNYRVTMQIAGSLPNNTFRTIVLVALHNGTPIIRLEQSSANTANGITFAQGTSVVFTALASTVRVDAAFTNPGTIIGNNTTEYTFSQIEEVDDYEFTTGF